MSYNVFFLKRGKKPECLEKACSEQTKIRWDMQFNPSKCQVIHITRSRSPLPTTYTLHGETLEAVASARYLGVDIAIVLSWKTHVSRITNTANKLLGLLRRNLKVNKGATIRNRYNQVPHLTQDTNGEVTNSKLDTTNESQEASPFPAGDHRAHINRRAQRHSKHKT